MSWTFVSARASAIASCSMALRASATSPLTSSSDLMSIFAPINSAARRTLSPRLPMASEDYLRSVRLLVDVDDDRFDAIALRVALGARLLAARDDSLVLAIEIDDHVAALEALHVAVFELAELADEFVVNLLALGLADL